MPLSRLLFCVSLILAPLALLGTAWLYTYPLLHGCAFPRPPAASSSSDANANAKTLAPFRLLALGDPQLEGDSSLPDPDAPIFPSIAHFSRHYDVWDISPRLAKNTVRDIGLDVRTWLEGKRKAVDLWGNDLYLAHIVRCLRWWVEPSHVAVLGDLLGSQWISDGEFEKRGERYWDVVMRGLEKIDDGIFGVEEGDKDKEEEGDLDKEDKKTTWGGTTQDLGADESWSKKVINIAGNHDVGYAGDLDDSRIQRFERAFGSVNWDIWFTLPEKTSTITADNSTSTELTATPALRLVILNSMNLDTPALSPTLQAETYDFLNHVISTSRPVTDKSVSTIVLTHIPLHKEAGICVDAPFFDFFDEDEGGGVREQNMLSDHASKMLLEGVFGLRENDNGGSGRRGLIIGGHDHEGCDVTHFLGAGEVVEPAIVENSDSNPNPDFDPFHINFRARTSLLTDAPPPPPPPPPAWKARRHSTSLPTPDSPHLREITLRSMMGEFSGYAGFLSAWFDKEKGEWVMEFETCGVGVQHWWWGVHIADVVVVLLVGIGAIVWLYERVGKDSVRRITWGARKGGVGYGVK